MIKEFAIFNAVIPRETFKVNNITKLLSPFIKNYRLRIQIDELKKNDLMAVIQYMQLSNGIPTVIIESLVTDCQLWSDCLRRFLEIGASAEIPKGKVQEVLSKIAPYIREFKMDDVRKPKHLLLIPSNLDYL